jgi:hypothetical protein
MLLCKCPHATIHVSSCYYTCPHTRARVAICVLILYMCHYATVCVSSYVSAYSSDCARRATRDPARPPPPLLAMLAQIHDLKRYFCTSKASKLSTAAASLARADSRSQKVLSVLAILVQKYNY